MGEEIDGSRAGLGALISVAVDQRQPRSNLARGSVVNLVAAAFAGVATFALTVILTRGTGTDTVGAFFTTTSVFLLLTSVGQLGTSTGLIYFLARAVTQGKPTPHEVLRLAMRPVLLVSLVMAVALLVLAGPLATRMGGGDGSAAALRLLAVFIPFAAALNVYTSATRGLGAMGPTAVIDQIIRPTVQVAFLAAVVHTGSVTWIALAWAAPYAPAVLLSYVWWRRLSGPVSHTEEARSGLGGAFWRFTAPRALASVAQLAMQRLDIVLVAGLAGLREAAVYTAATRFLVLGQMVGVALSRALQPGLGGATASGRRDEALALYRTSTAWLVLLVWPVYLVLSLISARILALFGSEYVAGAPVIVILALTMLVATACGMVDVVLTMAGRTSWNLYNVLAAFTLNITADLVLIPRFGVVGAAIGWALGILASNLIPLAQVSFSLRLNPFGRATLTAMCVTGVLFGAVPALLRLTLDPGLPILLMSLSVICLVYLVAAFAIRSRLDLGGRPLDFLRRRRPRR